MNRYDFEKGILSLVRRYDPNAELNQEPIRYMYAAYKLFDQIAKSSPECCESNYTTRSFPNDFNGSSYGVITDKGRQYGIVTIPFHNFAFDLMAWAEHEKDAGGWIGSFIELLDRSDAMSVAYNARRGCGELSMMFESPTNIKSDSRLMFIIDNIDGIKLTSEQQLTQEFKSELAKASIQSMDFEEIEKCEESDLISSNAIPTYDRCEISEHTISEVVLYQAPYIMINGKKMIDAITDRAAAVMFKSSQDDCLVQTVISRIIIKDEDSN